MAPLLDATVMDNCVASGLPAAKETAVEGELPSLFEKLKCVTAETPTPVPGTLAGTGWLKIKTEPVPNAVPLPGKGPTVPD